MTFCFPFARLGFITTVTLAPGCPRPRVTLQRVATDHLPRTTARDDARARDAHVCVYASADVDARRERTPREHERTR